MRPDAHPAGFIAATAPVVKQVRRRQLLKDFAQPFLDAGLDALRREDLRCVLNTLAQDLDDQARRLAAALASESTVPPYNKKFTGRLDELLDLRKRLTDDQAGVVCGVQGLGGIGKTELAFTYAHAFASAYPGGRFLVPCENKSSLREAALCLGDFHEIRARISDEERKQPDTHFAAIARCLDERLARLGHVLLVLDNVTDPALVSPAQTDCLTLLGPRLHLLATTRQLPPAGGNWLVLGELPSGDALALLEKHRPFPTAEERAAAEWIVKRLGGFALAVELLAAWLAAHPGASYAHSAETLGLADLEDMAGDQTVELRRHNHERRLTAVLGPVLAGLTPVERRTLEYAALLPPDCVALPWLRELVGRDFPDAFQATRLLADPWQEHWQRLVRLALFGRLEEETTEPQVVRVHRLVQDLVSREMTGADRAARQQAVEVLVEKRDAALKKTVRWQDARWELEPLDALAWLWAEPERRPLAGFGSGNAESRRDLDAPPPAHPRAAWLLSQVALRFQHLAEWSKAEPLMRRALAIDEASFGADHPDVARDLNNLATLLQATNRLGLAKPLMARVVSIFEKSLGENHPNVATALNNLALLQQATNRLGEAEPLLRRTPAMDEASFGADHPRVAIRLNNLAQLLKDTNRLGEAEPLMRRMVEIFLKFTRSTGHRHPHLQAAVSNYAGLLEAMGRTQEQILATLRELAPEFFPP